MLLAVLISVYVIIGIICGAIGATLVEIDQNDLGHIVVLGVTSLLWPIVYVPMLLGLLGYGLSVLYLGISSRFRGRR